MEDMHSAFDICTGYHGERVLIEHHIHYLKTHSPNSRGLPGLDLFSTVLGIGTSVYSKVLNNKKRKAELKKVRTTPLDIRLNNCTSTPIIVSSIYGSHSHSIDNILIPPTSQGTATVHFSYTLDSGKVYDSATVGLIFGSGEIYSCLDVQLQANLTFDRKTQKNVQGCFGVGRIVLSDSKDSKWGNSFNIQGNNAELRVYKMRRLTDMMKQITVVTASALDFETPLALTFYDSV